MSEERGKYMEETPADNTYQIRDEATPRDYFSQIPNLVDIMELSPHAYRLYGHLRKVAGENGKCWQSTKTLSKACNMSMGKVSQCKEELESVYPPLIRVESKAFDRGKYHEIAITDIWEINHKFWTGAETTIKTAKGAVFHNVNVWRSQYELLPSPGETKKNPIKEEPSNGADAPDASSLSIENQIAIGANQVIKPDEEKSRRLDFANLLAMGMGASAQIARDIAMAFQDARDITLPESKVKAQRKAVKDMIEMGVKAEHVKQATRQLIEREMTVSDLFSVVRTAIDLANSKPSDKPTERIPHIGV